MTPNGRFKVNIYSIPKTDVNPIILILYLFGVDVSRLFLRRTANVHKVVY